MSRGARVTLVAAVTFGALYITVHAHAADATLAQLPEALSKVDAIKRIYPDLYLREVARKPGPPRSFEPGGVVAVPAAPPTRSWERLRRAARTRWMRTHPCADATLERLYRLGSRSSWETVRATWACDGIDAGTQTFLTCIAGAEGGRTAPDVWYTSESERRANGGRNWQGWLGGKFEGTDRVVNHFQTRPYHARKVAPEVAGRSTPATAPSHERRRRHERTVHRRLVRRDRRLVPQQRLA